MLERLIALLPGLVALGGGLLLPGCGSTPDSRTGEPMGECRAVVTSYDHPEGRHVGECSDIEYAMNPPVFGDHYPAWAAYQSYDFPIPFGYLVHDLEHGAVVVLYDCAEGCADEVSEVQAFIDALPADPRCSADIRHQVILAPKPELGSRWAALAWGHSITADCFDPPLFRQFYDDHLAHGPEDFCSQGMVFDASPCQ